MAGNCCSKKKKAPKKSTANGKRRHKFSRFTGGTGCTFSNEASIKCSIPNSGTLTKGKSRSSFPRKGEPYRI